MLFASHAVEATEITHRRPGIGKFHLHRFFSGFFDVAFYIAFESRKDFFHVHIQFECMGVMFFVGLCLAENIAASAAKFDMFPASLLTVA